MFTGIIQKIGQVQEIQETDNGQRFVVNVEGEFLDDVKNGDSIAINGACMTVVNVKEGHFEFDLMPESLEKTNLGKNSLLNLEKAMVLGAKIDGHLVQGHIDDLGEVLELTKKNKAVILSIKFPKGMERYLALKGSISINGVSLTISHLDIDNFSVDLIPHTLENTNLGKLKKGDKVNLEIDLIARYLEALLNSKEQETKYNYLKDRNLI
jgi:riboflavin synthase